MDTVKSYHRWGYGQSFNLATRKNAPKDLSKTWIKMMKKLYSIAALSSIVGKIHLSRVKQITNQGTTSSSRRLMNTATIGESHLRDLNQNRIESSNFEFYEAIKKNKLHNFGTAIVAKIMKVRGKDIAIKIE